MPGKISSIDTLVNTLVSRKTTENTKVEENPEFKKDNSRENGDIIQVSGLGKKLKVLLEYLADKASEEEKIGFHFIMEEFISRPDSYDIINFVNSQIFLLNYKRDYLKEALTQAYFLKDQHLNPVLWLGVYSRLIEQEAINFIYITFWIFRYKDRSHRVKNLVIYLEEVRKIINENSYQPLDYRAELILSSGKTHIDQFSS
ncbi:MAG: hypothetical protein ACQEQG_04660 [Bacillota bacterium]